MRDGDGVRVDAPVGVGGGPPGGRAPFERLGVVELEAVEPVLVDIDHDRIAVLDERDGPAGKPSGPTWPMTSPTDPPENRASVIRAIVMFCWRHKVVIFDVGSSISGIPGAPRGPS